MKTKDSQLRKGVLELAVLAELERAPSYGGELLERLATNGGLRVSSGTLYPLLTRLRGAGFVAPRWQESPVGPPRKYYELTAGGRRQLANLTDAWRELSTAMTAILGQ